MIMHAPDQPQIHLPVGTQVVARAEIKDPTGATLCPRGAVGVVLQAPIDSFHRYRIRFANGAEAMLGRDDLTVRKQHQKGGLELLAADAHHVLEQHVIYRCVVGSRAYGLETDASDTDRRGIYLPPAEMQWSLGGSIESCGNKMSK